MASRLNIPNLLTWVRIALVPVFVLVFYLPYGWSNEMAALLFALAAVTDWLDGYLARRWQQTSAFGAFLDPVADKLMVAVVLVMLVERHPSMWLAVAAAVIIGREIAISGLREWMAEIGQRGTVKVGSLGKLKTTVQMLSLLLMLYRDPIGPLDCFEAGLYLLYLAAMLTLWSMLQYLRAAWPSFK